MKLIFQSIFRNALVLGLFAVAGTSLVGLTEEVTRDRIAANEREALLHNLNQVLPAASHDNDIPNDTIRFQVPELGGNVTVYRARLKGQPQAAVFTTVAPEGYAGPIKLLVGVAMDGRLTGVRVISHKETPGLGDLIELEKSDWVLGFAGKSLGDPTPQQWRVKKDGGVFDQFTGATITPRTVVKSVYSTLTWFQAHRDEVFPREEKAPTAEQRS
ncbi:MAG: electron transport complex subunit RsxG [Gammaproteobacteria bacterium]|nr:electron transport complex subunit RsxG [Gammaproteobacteria bacterium]